MQSTNVSYDDCYFIFQLALLPTNNILVMEMIFSPDILDGHIYHSGFSDYKHNHALLT